MENLLLATEYAGNVAGVETDEELVRLWLETRRSPLTRSGYAREWRWWRDRLAGVGLRALRLVHLQAVKQAGKPATIARRVAALRSLLAFAHRAGYVVINVGSVLVEPRRPDELAERILELEQVVQLLEGAGHGTRDHLFVRVAYVSGARVSELVRLDWRHVRAREGGGAVLTLHGKGDRTRHVWITPGTLRELEAHRGDAREETPVFRARTGARLGVRDAQRIVTRAARRAGLELLVSPHWLRHAHATHALEAGAPVHVVAADLGHASVATTTRYLHARPGTGSAEWLRF